MAQVLHDTEMKIPKRINPDNLKDTIVQVLFNPRIPPELVLGTFYHHFLDSFTFVASSPKRQELKLKGQQGLFLESLEEGYFLDKSEKVKINVSSKGIVFNIYKEYIGWDEYFPVIKSTIAKLFEIDLIENISRIGVRYISQFDNVNLPENLNIDLAVNMPNQSLDLKATQLRTEFVDGNFKVVLTLHNKISPTKDKEKGDSETSIIDVDVIQIFDGLSDLNKIIESINNGHQKQKTTFFSLLRPEFLETLNPEY